MKFWQFSNTLMSSHSNVTYHEKKGCLKAKILVSITWDGFINTGLKDILWGFCSLGKRQDQKKYLLLRVKKYTWTQSHNSLILY